VSFAQIPGVAIRDTVAAVFRAPVYNRTSLLKIVSGWLGEHVRAILLRFRPGRMPEPLFWVIVTVLLLVAAGVVARTAVVLLRERAVRPGEAGRGGPDGPGDMWATARELATRGDYTAAAHALYAGILGVIARTGTVELHESKTIGDYARDLAARSSALLGRFSDFARDYEVVIYGIGSCDRERYERLDRLAVRIRESHA